MEIPLCMYEKIHNPIIVCNFDGYIIYTNLMLKKMLDYLVVTCPKHICEFDDQFDKSDPHEPVLIQQRELVIKELKLQATVMQHGQGDCPVVYFFDTFMFESNIIDKVINHIDEVVVIFNEHGVLEKMNPVCNEMLPFKREQVIGRSIDYIIDQGLVTNPVIKDLLLQKKKIYKNVSYPNGKIIAYTAVPNFLPDGSFKGGVLTGRDISRLIRKCSRINTRMNQPEPDEYISQSNEMEAVKKMAIRAASSDSSIFITGESGTGKEVIAKMIYKHSRRNDKPFVVINCGAIPAALMESELFGYESGAFTGARTRGKKGLLEEANGGTVFFDEIGELPLEMQPKLLRAIQNGSITPVGSTKSIQLDIRYISATNVPSRELHKARCFRQDLYYRLCVIPLSIPPLRERRTDIPIIVQYFLDFYNEKYNRCLCILENVMALFMEYDWPGNIRELKNLIERFIVLVQGDVVIEDDFHICMQIDTEMDSATKKPYVRVDGYTKLSDVYLQVEQLMIPEAIKRCGSIVKAAEELGINPSTIHRKIKNREISID